MVRRLITVIAAVAMIAAGCGDDDGSSTSVTTGSSTSTSSSTPSTSTTSSTTTTTTEPAPTVVELEVTPYTDPDPDPMETIEPLTGVEVSTDADGNLVFTFADSQYGGLGVQLTGLPETDFLACDWYPEEDFPGDGEGTGCFAQTADAFVGSDPVSNGAAPPMSVVMAMTVTMDSVSVTLEGMTFTGDGLRFDDGPLFVQIDPNTGGLAEPVIRRAATISAADLYTALNA